MSVMEEGHHLELRTGGRRMNYTTDWNDVGQIQTFGGEERRIGDSGQRVARITRTGEMAEVRWEGIRWEVSRDSINRVNKRELAKWGSERGDQGWRRGGIRRRRLSPAEDASRKATSRTSVRILPYVISVMTRGICQHTA
jgi:hypothetical protein